MYNYNKVYNTIINKIPHIYGEIFLTLFKNKLNYFNNYNQESLLIIIKRLFLNFDKINNQEFYYKYLLKDLYNIDEYIINEISLYLSSSIDITLLKDISTNNFLNNNYINIDNFYNFNNKEKKQIYETITSYLLAKLLLRIILILTKYNNTTFKERIIKDINIYYNANLDISNILDTYHKEYKIIFTKDEYQILSYLLFISIKGNNIESIYYHKLNKIFMSNCYDIKLTELPNKSKCYNYLAKEHNKNNSYILELFNYRELPLIPITIKELLDNLFTYNYDNYYFLINKDNILKTIYYLYIRNISIDDIIYISTNYKLWSFYWDFLKNKYQEKKSI